MFDIANDRLSYGQLLAPKPGYTLEFAVGTTYSLDLEALLGVPVSLGLLEEADSEQLGSPLYVLEAIRTSADKIALFCNGDGIKVPDRIQTVYSLLEKSIFPVKMPNHANFHPKLWLLKYCDGEGEAYLKLLVLSRNLTFDTSIDLCVAMQGRVGRARRLKNKPLADMLTQLAAFAPKAKERQILALAEAVMHVARFEVDDPFEDYEFLPMGIPGYSGEECGLFRPLYDLFVVSPFLSDDIVEQLTRSKGKKTLVTRKASITAGALAAFDRVFVTRDLLSDNEFGTKQDIHAKLYYTTTQQGNYLYIGSANASHNAFYRNTECLLRLKCKPWSRVGTYLEQEFLREKDSAFEQVTCLPERPAADPEERAFEQALREAVYALKWAAVIREGERYCLRVESKERKSPCPVTIAPLQRPELAVPLQRENLFCDLLLKELSEFYVLSVQGRSVVVKVDTRGMPRERDEAIYRSIIDSRSKFLAYLSFMLTEDPTAVLEGAGERDSLGFGDPAGPAGGSAVALYEKMLRVFHRDPGRLKGIADMVRRLEVQVVGEEFLDMFEQFELAARKVRT